MKSDNFARNLTKLMFDGYNSLVNEINSQTTEITEKELNDKLSEFFHAIYLSFVSFHMITGSNPNEVIRTLALVYNEALESHEEEFATKTEKEIRVHGPGIQFLYSKFKENNELPRIGPGTLLSEEYYENSEVTFEGRIGSVPSIDNCKQVKGVASIHFDIEGKVQSVEIPYDELVEETDDLKSILMTKLISSLSVEISSDV